MNLSWPEFAEDFQPHQFKIRQVGIAESERSDLLFIPMEKKKEELSFKKMAVPFDSISTQQSARSKVTPNKKKITSIQVSEKEMSEMLKSSPMSNIPMNAQKALSKSDINISLEVPKGIPEDELNKYELVFYSFQKRTVMAYISSFFNELNQFELENPHLNFPMIKEPEQVAGRITYDENGDILKIDTLKWSDVDKLQSFFMEVLKNMNSLPNPPKELIKDGKFAINFVLTLNQ